MGQCKDCKHFDRRPPKGETRFEIDLSGHDYDDDVLSVDDFERHGSCDRLGRLPMNEKRVTSVLLQSKPEGDAHPLRVLKPQYEGFHLYREDFGCVMFEEGTFALPFFEDEVDENL